jgi:hypothetical protein
MSGTTSGNDELTGRWQGALAAARLARTSDQYRSVAATALELLGNAPAGGLNPSSPVGSGTFPKTSTSPKRQQTSTCCMTCR